MGMVSFFLFSFLAVGVVSGQRMLALWDWKTSSQDPAPWWHGKKAGKGEKRALDAFALFPGSAFV